VATNAATVAIVVLCVNVPVGLSILGVSSENRRTALALFTALALAQFIAGLVAATSGYLARRAAGTMAPPGAWPMVLGVLTTLGALVGWLLGWMGYELIGLGGAWGRPLRVRGRQRHPELTEGADWTHGHRPDATALAEDDRRALEALWLHDAQKEHASVPAFSRLSWALAAVGAPAELLAWAHRAALEEIDHAQRCFALAAGYGGRSFTVEPMPDLLHGALELDGDVVALLARESVSDGGQLEDFNADVAAACAAVCEEPVTRHVLEQIAREERSHADFSWALITWLLERHPERAWPAVRQALAELERYPRPKAVSTTLAPLVSRASPEVLRRHGRLPDQQWAALWEQRLVATRARVQALDPDRVLSMRRSAS
jgi:hypothetical protein